MQEKVASSIYTVTNKAAIKFLQDAEATKMLKPFFKNPTTASQAAKELNKDINWMYKKIKRLESLDLLYLHHSKARKGRALNYYKTKADAFIISPDHYSLESFFLQLGHQYELLLTKEIIKELTKISPHPPSLRISLIGQEIVSTILSHPDGRTWDVTIDGSSLYTKWRHLNLSYEDARALQVELQELEMKYVQKQIQGGQTYLLRLAFATKHE